MTLDREVVESRLASLLEALDVLATRTDVTLDRYLSDVFERSGIERLLCRLVDTAGEINGHIAASELGRAPTDYYDSFLKAAEAGALDQAFAREVAASTGVRNRIVHAYETVDHQVVHASIPKAVEEYRRYVTEITDFLDRKTG